MVSGHEVVGRVVLEREGGEQVGELKDLIVAQNGTRVVALLVAPGGLAAGTRVAPWESIQSFGPDAVIIDRRESLRKKDELPEVAEILDRGNSLVGRKVHTTEGRILGRIEGFYFEEQSGEIAGYELSHEDAQSSDRSFLPADDQLEAGKDVVFVPSRAGDKLTDLHLAEQTGFGRAA